MFRLKAPSAAMVVACTALFVALGGGAYAATQIPASSISHSKLKQDSVWHSNLGQHSVWLDNLSANVQDTLKHHAAQGPTGPKGSTGATGATGATGPAGPTGFNGAFYSVQNYTNTVGAGAIATAACDPNDATNSQKYVAIAGGLESAQTGTNMTTNDQDLPVTSSFPGRMDWSTYTPIPGRLDGWIVKLASGGGQQDNGMEVWALCLPAADAGSNGVPVNTN